MECLSSTIAVTLPSFVVVTLTPEPCVNVAGTSNGSELLSTAVKPKTLRVPLSTGMTVRELAKAAMMRYMLSLRRTAKEAGDAVRQLCRRGISVTDVYILLPSEPSSLNELGVCVTGNDRRADVSPVRTVELFSDDCVVQVVQVMRETVYMRFRAVSSPAAKRGIVSPQKTLEGAKAPCTGGGAALGDVAMAITPTKNNCNSIVTSPLPIVNADDPCCDGPHVPRRGETTRLAATSHCDVQTVVPAAEENSSTPVIERQPSITEPHRAERVKGDSDSEVEDYHGNAEQENIALSIATLREREAQRLRWGPEAHKHFAANYVSSPEKIMIGRFKCSRRQPPSVQLHRPNTSFAASSPESTADTHSQRSSRENGCATECSSFGESPPGVDARKENNNEEKYPHAHHEHRASTQPPYKTHRSDTGLFPCLSTESVPAMLAVSSTVPCHRIQATAAQPLPEYSRVNLMMEDSITQCPIRSPGEKKQSGLLCSLTTPVAIPASTDTTPSAPGTVAKPVVEVVARQLSFEEDGDTPLKGSSAVINRQAASSVSRVMGVV